MPACRRFRARQFAGEPRDAHQRSAARAAGRRGAPRRFVWPTRQQRWNYLSTATLKSAPGSQASYSNLAFDLLADALSSAAGKPYPQLFEEQITRPLGMKDTTFTPSPDQCKRLMVAEKGASPCNNTLAAVGSGGVYSTRRHDALDAAVPFFGFYSRSSPIVCRLLSISVLSCIASSGWTCRVKPMHSAGLGLYGTENGRPGIIQKTGGGGGFITYMAMIPQSNVGAFVVVTRSPNTRFVNMSDGINNPVAELSANKARCLLRLTDLNIPWASG